MDPLLLELLTRLSEAETGDWISETEESGDKGIDMAISTKKKKKKIIKTKKKARKSVYSIWTRKEVVDLFILFPFKT